MSAPELQGYYFRQVRKWTDRARRSLVDPLSLWYWEACTHDLTALKPGNVHCYAQGHDMTVEDFLKSAYVTAPVLANPEMTLGVRIFESVRVTQQAVAKNTNLGILLLCAPIAQSALSGPPTSLRKSLIDTISQTSLEDSQRILDAICLAAPSGLGESECHDVFSPATTRIQEIMSVAGSRDMVAQQYTNGFEEVFKFGTKVLHTAQASKKSMDEVVSQVYLAFLSSYPDSHIARQYGSVVASEVQSIASDLYSKSNELESDSKFSSALMKCDTVLKSRDINPGTSADLTVATIYVNKIKNGNLLVC